MNVIMNPDIYERLWSALRTDFDLVITNYLSKRGWGYETLAAAAKYRHVTAYYNWIGVKQGRFADAYIAHGEAVIKLIIKTAKEAWLPPWPVQPKNDDGSSDNDGGGVRGFGYPKNIVALKRKIGGLFLLWLVYQNQPRSPQKRFPIELCIEDVDEIKNFEEEMKNLNVKIRGRGISGLRLQVKTIICQLKTCGAFDIVLNRDTLGADEFMRNYLQLRTQLGKLGEVDLAKESREKFLFDGKFSNLLTTLEDMMKEYQNTHKKLTLDVRISEACEPHIAIATKLKTREERYDFFKELMLRLIREKNYSADHPFVKKMYVLFDKVIMEAPPSSSKSRSSLKFGKSDPPPEATIQENKSENIQPMDSSFCSTDEDEDFEMVSIPGELKIPMLTSSKCDGSRTPERQGIIDKTFEISPAKSTRSIESDLLFPDFTSNSGSSPRRIFESPTKTESSPVKLESIPGLGYLNDANAISLIHKSSLGGSAEKSVVGDKLQNPTCMDPQTEPMDEEPNFWNKMTMEEKREFARNFKINSAKMLKAKTLIAKLNQDMESLAKRAMTSQQDLPVTRDTLVAEAVRARQVKTTKPRKSRAKPRDDLTVTESPETLGRMMSSLKIEPKVQERILDQFHEMNSKDEEVVPVLDGSKVGFGKYMEMVPKTQDKAISTDADDMKANDSSSSSASPRQPITLGDLSKESPKKRRSPLRKK